jgi:Asp/Glu/hydantoin racemase
MRVLVINPNTSGEVTARLVRHLGPLAGDCVELVPVTGRFGARYIASRAAATIAAHAALDALAEHGDGCAAIFLACFGDPGLQALKETSPVPVVGMAEGSCHLACTLGRSFSIVTGGDRWGPMLREFVASLGLSSRLASVRTVAPTGGEIARDPEAAVRLLADQASRCAAEDGADVIVVGGDALAGLAARVAPRVSIPVICSAEAAFRLTLAVADLQGARSWTVTADGTAPETTGLAPALARRLRS